MRKRNLPHMAIGDGLQLLQLQQQNIFFSVQLVHVESFTWTGTVRADQCLPLDGSSHFFASVLPSDEVII